MPAGADCVLNGVTVRGGVTVLAGGNFWAFNSEIRGAVVANPGSLGVALKDHSVVRGPVTITQLAQRAFVQTTEVRGNLTITDSGGSGVIALRVSSSVIRGSVIIVRNGITDFPSPELHNNTIDVDLICEENTGLGVVSLNPTGNVVGGATIGDCS